MEEEYAGKNAVGGILVIQTIRVNPLIITAIRSATILESMNL